MKYSDLFSNRFRPALDNLMEKITDFKMALRLKKLKETISKQAQDLDETRNDLLKKARKEWVSEADKEKLLEQVNKMSEEEIKVDKIVIEGIENMGLNALILEQLDCVIELKDPDEPTQEPAEEPKPASKPKK